MELLGILDEEREIAKRGMKIWYEEEFAEIEAKHKKELSIKDAELDKKDAEITINQAQYKKQLVEKDQTHAVELAEKDEEIARLNTLLKTNGIS